MWYNRKLFRKRLEQKITLHCLYYEKCSIMSDKADSNFEIMEDSNQSKNNSRII